MGHFKQAAEIYLQSHALDPSEASPLICAATVMLRAGDIPKAIELATQATQCGEGPIDEAYFNLGGYFLIQRRYEEARNCYMRALEIDPEYEWAKHRLEDVERVLLLRHTESVPIHLLPGP